MAYRGWHPPLAWPERRLTDEQRDEVERHLSLAGWAASQARATRQCRRLEYDDLLQAAALGLMEAVRRMDPSRGGLTTLVKLTARCEIHAAIRTSTVVSIPMLAIGGRRLKSNPELIAAADRATTAAAELDERIDQSCEDDDPGERIDAEERIRQLLLAVEILPDRGREVVLARLEGRTQAEIAREMGETRQMVHQWERRAHARLRRLLEGWG